MDQAAFLMKKVLGGMMTPVPIMILLLFWALLLLLKRKTRWVGYLVVLLVATALLVGSYAPLSKRIIGSYEEVYPAYQRQQLPAEYIVVLGTWHQSTRTQPITSEIQSTGIVRLVEAIRIYHLNPGSKLVLTGYRGLDEDPVSYPVKLSELAMALQIPRKDIIVFGSPRDTAEEAQLIAREYSEERLVLVTTAMHMPRAMGLFEGLGLAPQPAPTGHMTKPETSWWNFPSAATLERTSYWTHEQLGSLWARLLGQFESVTSKE